MPDTVKIHKIRLTVEIEMTTGQVAAYAKYQARDNNPGVRAVREDIRSWLQNTLQVTDSLSVEDGNTQSVTVR